MNMKLPVVLLSVLALAAPGVSYAKDKNKNKGPKGQSSENRRNGGNADDDRDRDRDGNEKITICHIPPGNPAARRTLSVGASAWPSHEGHGDRRGACRRR